MVIGSHEIFKESILEEDIKSSPVIDWVTLGHAHNYYQSLRYEYIETPWLVPQEYSKVTKPHNNESFQLNKSLFKNQPHELVGSAEQGFLYLLLNNKLKKGQYFSITPCFRVETYNKTHQPWFVKLELFAIGHAMEDYQKMVKDAFNFFQIYGKPEVIELEDKTTDININSIEVGSYGIRAINNKYYAYGTGLALPRLNVALENA